MIEDWLKIGDSKWVLIEKWNNLYTIAEVQFVSHMMQLGYAYQTYSITSSPDTRPLCVMVGWFIAARHSMGEIIYKVQVENTTNVQVKGCIQGRIRCLPGCR